MNSRIILTRDNIGPKMCIRECLRIKNCNGINFHKDILKCELLSDSNLKSQLVSTPGYSYSDISDWKMEADSCWPNNPCQEKTRCIPSKSNDHVCLMYVLSKETFLESISSPGFPDRYEHNLDTTWTIEVGTASLQNLETFLENISSPGFPDRYEHNLDTTWTIEVGIGISVALRFTYFDLEFSYDFVKVYECGVNADTLLGSFTGQELPPEVRSTGNCIRIIMKTDNGINNIGFSANVYKITS
ncbi:unnamed protein product [Mytilus coruscus]|uniref:CUB domain-containing protein n=1 Tax=Mytilus coruscus TaxID=42192 RepID=A0A6J8EPT1_MYTCO|nr:unnamed protein product [Mytilus coruscus]